MKLPAKWAAGLRVAVLVLMLGGLATAVAYEGLMLNEQSRQLELLEANNARFRAQILQMSHGITGERDKMSQRIRNLEREIAVLKLGKPVEQGISQADPIVAP